MSNQTEKNFGLVFATICKLAYPDQIDASRLRVVGRKAAQAWKERSHQFDHNVENELIRLFRKVTPRTDHKKTVLVAKSLKGILHELERRGLEPLKTEDRCEKFLRKAAPRLTRKLV